MKLRYISIITTSVALSFSSCNFLDKVPDTRVDLSTPEQLSLLLVDGYSSSSMSVIGELSSDNVIDNNSPDSKGNYFHFDSYEKMDDEIFAWEDIKSNSEENSPSKVWEGAYHAIAIANAVLAKIPEFEAQGLGDKVKAQKGEALIIRAYNHFMLANVFCQQYRGEDLSKSLQGIPYVTEPETTVMVQYERKDLASVYANIEADLLAGLPLINDGSYSVPKYHFNKKAANAFAARFYLFKRDYEKVIKYSTEALGGEYGNPSSLMRTCWSKSFTTSVALIQDYISAESLNNFLIIPTYSVVMRRAGKNRYTWNRDGSAATVDGPGPTWSNYNFHPCFSGKLYVRGSQEYGVFFPKNSELFEYTDKVAGIGYAHEVRCEFTAEETLLCRAEAKIYMHDLPGALADLKIWDDARQNNSTTAKMPPLTDALIRSFYEKKDPGYGIVKPLNIDQVCPSDKYSVSADMVAYLQCVLHYRRIETVYDGFRWFDIKRYGIEITHNIGKNRVEKLTWDDPRRALQLPAEVIAAGMVPTHRSLVTTQPPIEKVNYDYIKK